MNLRRLIVLACLTCVGASLGDISAQDVVPAFDVVSVKPNASGGTNSSSIVQPREPADVLVIDRAERPDPD